MPDWGIALLLALASLLWSALAISASPGLSRYDEWTYIDYSYRISNGELPIQGDELSEYARQSWSCRGMEGDIRGVVPPPCSEAADHPASSWPFEGENYNAFHPPLYFMLAGATGTIADSLGGDFTDGARAGSALLAAAGAAALFLAIRTWKVSRLNAAGGTLIAMSVPALAQSAAIVHNDAVSMLAGAAAVWLAARFFLHRNDAWFVPFAVTALISATRTMSVVAILTVGILAFMVGLGSRQWTRLKPSIAIAAGTMVPYIAWTAFQNSRRPADYIPSIMGLSTEPFDAGDTLAVINTLIGGGAPWGLTSPAGDWYLHPDLNSTLLEGWSWLLYATFLLLLPLSLIVIVRGKGPIRYLAGLVILLPVVTALVVQSREILSNDAYFRAVSGRYAITAVPMYVAFIAVAAHALWERSAAWFRWVVPGAGAAGYAILMLSPVL